MMQNLLSGIRDKSTTTKFEFVMDHVFFSIVFAISLYRALPVYIQNAEYSNSYYVLAKCMLIASVVGIVTNYLNNRRVTIMMLDVMMGLSLYVSIIFSKYVMNYLLIVLFSVLILSAIGVMLIIERNSVHKRLEKQIFADKLIRSIQLVHRNLGIAAFIIMLVIPGRLLYLEHRSLEEYNAKKAVNEEIEAVDSDGANADEVVQEEKLATQYNLEMSIDEAYGDEFSLQRNIDVIKLIRDDNTFQALDYESKCEVIRRIVYCEARYLGLCEINVVFKDFDEDYLLGQFDNGTKTIYVNSKHVKSDSNEKVLNTILHETRHCYQHLVSDMFIEATPQQRNLYMYKEYKVVDWIQNFLNYVSSGENGEKFMEYYDQEIELDARKYAEENIHKYFEEIDRILRQQEE